MELRKLLIADSSEEFCRALEQALTGLFHVRCCHDGNIALDLLRRERFEVLVLNLMLPGLDGITILERIASEGICPKVLAQTPLLNDYILQSAEVLEVGYLMRKPCEIQATVARICDLNRPIRSALPTRDMRAYLSELLLTFPMPSHLLGYQLLRECILLKVRHPDMSATKELYPTAAALCGRKGCNVERNIRTVLDKAWANPNPQVWQKYFPPSEKRPDSMAFISRIADDLRLKQSQGLLDPYDP